MNNRLYSALIRGYCALAEFRDPETGTHLDRLSAYVRILAGQLAADSPYAAQVSPEFIESLSAAVPLHDIGKVGIPDRILLKPGPLTAAEMEIMKTHTIVGRQFLLSVRRMVPGELEADLALAADIAGCHHERWDGTGYPLRQAGGEIPLAARITALADVYDAVTTHRVYRTHVFTPDEVRDLIYSGSGHHFDPVVVAAFAAAEARFARLHEDMADAAPARAEPSVVRTAAAREQPAQILLVDDEPQVRRIMRIALTGLGHRCDEADNVAAARRMLVKQHYDLVTLDIRMPGEQGTVLLPELAARAPYTAVIMVTGEGDIRVGMDAMRAGAYDYLIKPLDLDQVRLSVTRAVERQRLEQEVIVYRNRLEQLVAARTRELAAALALAQQALGKSSA